MASVKKRKTLDFATKLKAIQRVERIDDAFHELSSFFPAAVPDEVSAYDFVKADCNVQAVASLVDEDTSVASPGIQMQLPAAQHVEAPYYGNFTTTVFDSSILSQPAQTEQGLLSTPPPSSYDYVSAPSYTYGAPSPDLVCSTPHNGILSPGVTPNICASDATLAYGQEVVAVQQPQQQPQQLVTSYSPVPFTGMVFSCEHPAPTVNLAAQRSNDPEGRDLPAGTSPVFSSENRKWQESWEHYKTTSHTHLILIGIEKFKYLKTCLAGASKRAIEKIHFAKVNYNMAVKVLTKRFG
ncbi:hypothetical protein HPB51_012928 [Rhipicephalus microplus]|uniref:Uncharacterized protein n=1 Tax=Rhipicephalus microplus TaxID=6941 RepID=A0A9J6F1Q1_RHIMP|nr:hypothetical protein HPB51_012928 [Rhipicephalus microplus]